MKIQYRRREMRNNISIYEAKVIFCENNENEKMKLYQKEK